MTKRGPMSKEKKENAEFYQIRITPELKKEFMHNCHQQALNPSAVMRMLMTQWTASNHHDAKNSNRNK